MGLFYQPFVKPAACKKKGDKTTGDCFPYIFYAFFIFFTKKTLDIFESGATIKIYVAVFSLLVGLVITKKTKAANPFKAANVYSFAGHSPLQEKSDTATLH